MTRRTPDAAVRAFEVRNENVTTINDAPRKFDIPLTDEERLLATRIEELVGGRVVALERQARWRKAWYVTVERDGVPLSLYIRGDKQIDAEPYPGLDREAAILTLLEEGGIPVPHVYGMSTDPIGIVMDRVPGTRDVSEATDDAERRSVAEQYIEALAQVHRLEVTPFVVAGITLPDNPSDLALAYVDANEKLYRRTKTGPEPIVEFALRWLRRHVPEDRYRPSLILADTGQFLFEDGRITCLYDLEAAHIGDPLFDLASLRTRAGTEPLGADIEHMVRHYEKVTGEKVNPAHLSYYTAAFMLTSVCSLSGPLSDPDAQNIQAEYLTWDLMTRRAMLWAIAEVVGIDIEPAPPAEPPTGYYARVTRVLEGTAARMTATTPMDEANRASAVALSQWAGALISVAADNARRDLDRVETLLGHRPASASAADRELEEFILEAGPDHDDELLAYFIAQTEARVAEAISLKHRLDPYALEPIRL